MRKRCIDCGHRYQVGQSPRCNICRRRRERDTRHDAHLRQRYGIGIDDYYQLLASQGGGCAICGGGTSYRYFNLDHNHKTGEPRGLLCATCNKRLLPAAKDDPARLRKAAHYLEHPPARDVLGERDWTAYAD
jgi:hypothetical protein